MKKVSLTKGMFALVDNEDFEFVSRYKWQANYAKSTDSYYAQTTVRIGKNVRKTIKMHRIVLAVNPGEQVDHKNGITLDNTKNNLRVCSAKENARNRKRPRNNTTGFKGIKWHERLKKWEARLNKDGRYIYLGIYKDKEDAAKAYDTGAQEHFGKFARTNI